MLHIDFFASLSLKCTMAKNERNTFQWKIKKKTIFIINATTLKIMSIDWETKLFFLWMLAQLICQTKYSIKMYYADYKCEWNRAHNESTSILFAISINSNSDRKNTVSDAKIGENGTARERVREKDRENAKVRDGERAVLYAECHSNVTVFFRWCNRFRCYDLHMYTI